MKITIHSPRPRNPWVAAAMFRLAGMHRSSERSRRQRNASALRRELKEMKHIP